MHTDAGKVVSADYADGYVTVRMASGIEIRFPISGNRQLACGTADQLRNIQVSPNGLHWPDLDEDLSFKGLMAGDYGQVRKVVKRRLGLRDGQTRVAEDFDDEVRLR